MRGETGRREVAAPASAAGEPAPAIPAWLAGPILGLSGFAALVHEIVWTRILALVLGPTIYAFAATLAAVIAGVALGSAAGTSILGRTQASRRLARRRACRCGGHGEHRRTRLPAR